MRWRARSFVLFVSVFLTTGCQQSYSRYQIRMLIDTSSIPDSTYEITAYRGVMPQSYAVLFDIPNDRVEVFMEHSPFTEKIGQGSAGVYIDEFHARIKRHRAVRINDQEETVRGYLMVSNILNDRVQFVGKRILVTIQDPYNEYLRSPR